MPNVFRSLIVVALSALFVPCAAWAQAPIEHRSGAGRAPDRGPVRVASLPSAASGAPIDLRAALRPQRQSRPAVAASAPAPAPVARPAWLEAEQVSPPYEAHGRWYAPTPEPGFAETGLAALYPQGRAGRPTASGEAFDPEAITAAHPTLPIPSLVQVTDLGSGREAIVRVNDRGPFAQGQLIALSPMAARALGAGAGARVHMRYLGPAPKRVAEPGAVAVETRAPLRAQGAGQGYYVQVGAFGSRANAEAALARVQRLGQGVIAEGAGLYRVRLGPEPDRATAQAALARAAAAGFSGARVIGPDGDA